MDIAQTFEQPSSVSAASFANLTRRLTKSRIPMPSDTAGKDRLRRVEYARRPVSLSPPLRLLRQEENALVRAAMAERLRVAGFEVVEVATSAEADCVLRTTLVDALIQTTSAA
jgi:hypothetical protein